MKDTFLKAKHWQIFLAIFIVPYSLRAIAMAITKSNPEKTAEISPFIMVIFLLGLFGWLWSIATRLKEKIPAGVKMKMTKFKLLLFIPVIYIPVSFCLFDIVLDNLKNSPEAPNIVLMVISLAIMVPLHILSIFGFLYSFYFVAKTCKTAELQKEVKFSDFAGDFLLLLFFPIGVWVMQPKINKLSNNDADQK